MKRSGLLAVLAATLIATMAMRALAATARFIDVRRTVPVHGDPSAAKEKAAACSECHGANGNSAAPAFPSLAGLSPEYIFLQLKSYRRGWRNSPIMQPQAASLSDQDMSNLAAYYAGFARTAKNADAPAAASEGERLYLEGDVARGVPPCQGCHGAHAAGHPLYTRSAPAYATYPALAGQSSDYMRAQLSAFREGSRSTTTNALIMNGVTHSLDDHGIDAIATYLERL